MAKFQDLQEQDRIQYVKNRFMLILEQLAKEPTKLKDYIKLEQPKAIVAAIEAIRDTNTDAEINAITARNLEIQEKVAIANEKKMIEFKEKEEIFKKIENIVSKLNKKEGCICGACVDINITNSVVPPELEILIDAARKEAEEINY